MLDILLVVLLDQCGNRLEGGEDEVGDRKSDLLLGGQRCRKRDLVVFGRALNCQYCKALRQQVCILISPSLIQCNDLHVEGSFRGILLVLGLQSTNPADHMLLKGQVVLRLRLLVDVLNYDIDCLARIVLLQVDVSHEVGVAEVLRRLEGRREDVLRALGKV